MNTEYIVEILDGHFWREEFVCDDIDEAIQEMIQLKISLPKRRFRIIKCQWQVVE